MNRESCLIKRATVEDADILADVGKRTYLQYFSSIWGAAKLQYFLAEHFSPDILAAQLANIQYHGFLIASIAEQPVGFVKINWHRQDPVSHRPGAELQKLFVDARFTDRGIGRRLLKSSLILVQEEQEEVLWLQILIENEAAQRFYRRYGFAPIGQIPFRTDVHKSALVTMVFNLAATGAHPIL